MNIRIGEGWSRSCFTKFSQREHQTRWNHFFVQNFYVKETTWNYFLADVVTCDQLCIKIKFNWIRCSSMRKLTFQMKLQVRFCKVYDFLIPKMVHKNWAYLSPIKIIKVVARFPPITFCYSDMLLMWRMLGVTKLVWWSEWITQNWEHFPDNQDILWNFWKTENWGHQLPRRAYRLNLSLCFSSYQTIPMICLPHLPLQHSQDSSLDILHTMLPSLLYFPYWLLPTLVISLYCAHCRVTHILHDHLIFIIMQTFLFIVLNMYSPKTKKNGSCCVALAVCFSCTNKIWQILVLHNKMIGASPLRVESKLKKLNARLLWQ